DAFNLRVDRLQPACAVRVLLLTFGDPAGLHDLVASPQPMRAGTPLLKLGGSPADDHIHAIPFLLERREHDRVLLPVLPALVESGPVDHTCTEVDAAVGAGTVRNPAGRGDQPGDVPVEL